MKVFSFSDGDDDALDMSGGEKLWTCEDNHLLDEVDFAILHERQAELREIEEDTLSISEIMTSLSFLINEQGENLAVATEHVASSVESTDAAVNSLENALGWKNNMRCLLVDATTIITGSGLGALGFIGGPLVGVPTLVGGLLVAASVIAIRRNLSTQGSGARGPQKKNEKK